MYKRQMSLPSLPYSVTYQTIFNRAYLTQLDKWSKEMKNEKISKKL